MTHINLLRNTSNHQTQMMVGGENLNTKSTVVDPCMPSKVVVQYNGTGSEPMTPIMFRAKDSLLEQRKDENVDFTGA